MFLANDPFMNRVVAVKVLTATDDPGSFNRFKNEATAAGNLRHENIVTVHEFGLEGQTPFLVMEYLDGEDLQQLIKKQAPMSLYQKVRLMDKVADGLHFAHRQGVLHRDVKPANIMVLRNGAVKIMDFGIARLLQDQSPRLTQQGYLIGTVVYMAPELFGGTEVEVDALCDIWSYGVVLYELLSGKNPFQTGSMQSEMYRIVHQELPPLATDHCPAELQPVINKLLSRQRESRYQSLEDMRFDLQPILKNLERAEAERLLSSAQELMFQRQFDEALEMARQARKMDPQNGTARIIFERIQDEKRKQSVQSRIDDLLRLSHESAQQKNIPEAIAHTNAALKFDPHSEKALDHLRYLRNLSVKLQEAVTLVAESDKELQDGRLTDAFAHASDALSHDPDNREAKRLLENIQRAIQMKEAERALDAELLRVRGLMAIHDLDGAMEVLRAAESKYLQRADTIELAAKIAKQIAERKRSAECIRLLDQARNLVRAARFADAVSELEQLLKAFPNEAEALDLLAYAKQELKAKRNTGEVNQIAATATELIRAQRFDEAIRVIEGGLKAHPDELALSQLLRSTYLELQNFERQRALRDGLKRCDELRAGGRWQDALNLIALLQSDNPGNQELQELTAKIKQEMSQTARASAVRESVERVEKLLKDGRPDLAISAVESAIYNIGAVPELTALQKKAKETQQAQGDRKYIDGELKRAETFADRGDVATSLKIIEGALSRFPKAPELQAAKERFSALRKNAPSGKEAADTSAPTVMWQSGAPAPDEPPGRTTGSVPISPPIAEVAAAQDAPKPKWQIYGIAGVAVAAVVGLAMWMLSPAVKITPEKLTFAYQAGTEPRSQTITVTSSKSIPDPKSGGNWIRFQRRDVGSGKAEFVVEVSPDQLAPGSHTADLAFGSQKVRVDLLVPTPTLSFQPAALNFSHSPGTIPAQKVVVTSRSDIPDPKPSAPWITFTRRNLGQGKAEFEVRVSSAGLAAGPHAAALQFASAGKLPVSLTLPGGSTIEAQPAFLAFPRGGPQQRIIVTGPGTIPDPTPSERWVTFTRASAIPGKAEFVVQVSTDGLEPGKRYANLVFSPDRKVVVELTISDGGSKLDIQPDSLSFGAGGIQQLITVSGAGVIPDPVSTDPWLTFTRQDAAAGKAEFVVQVSPNGLVPGPHVAYLTFSAEKQVRVELTIAPPKPLDVQPTELRFKYKKGGPVPPPQVITASGPSEIPEPTKKAPWLQWTRKNSGAKTEFAVQLLPDKVSDSGSDDVIFSPQKKVRVDVLVMDVPDAAPAATGTIFWGGGTLNPGDELWIKKKRVIRGP